MIAEPDQQLGNRLGLHRGEALSFRTVDIANLERRRDATARTR